MTKWLDLFSIKQKLAILLLFLLSALSYIVLTTISDTAKYKQSNIKIEVAQQQHLIVEQFINAFFFARQQANITGNKIDSSEIKNNQDRFQHNLKALLNSGKADLDLTTKNSIQLNIIANKSIRSEVLKSQVLWGNLQSASQNLPLKSVEIEQLTIFYHIKTKLREKLQTIVNSLIKQRDKNAQADLLTLQLSWLFTLILGALFTWLIDRNITQPLDSIANLASRIRLGNLRASSEENTHHDELGTLLYQADEMRLALSELMLNIQQHNKQMLYSCSQVKYLTGETNSLQHLQYHQYEEISAQLKTLLQHNDEHLKELADQTAHHTNNHKKIDEYWKTVLININVVEAIQNTNNHSIDNFEQLKLCAEHLYQRLENIQQVAIKTQNVAKKITHEATHPDQQNEQFILATNKVTHFAMKTANDVAAISPLLQQFQTQLNAISIPLKHTDQQLSHSLQQFSQSNELIDSIKNELEKQQNNANNLTLQSEQQALKITAMHNSLQDSLLLIKESGEKIDASNLLVQGLNNIGLQLEKLSHEFKLDETINRMRKGNEKRFYPRINNQLKVSLQQGDQTLQGLTQDLSLSGLQLKSMQSMQFNHRTPVSFTINLPSDELENSEQAIILLGDVLHYEQIDDEFYYGAHFHPLTEQEKNKLQQTFDYFEKRSEFKN